MADLQKGILVLVENNKYKQNYKTSAVIKLKKGLDRHLSVHTVSVKKVPGMSVYTKYFM